MELPIIAKYIIAAIVAYLIGAVPMGLLVVRALTGRDVRNVGSGRTGGTNAMRAGGVASGILTGLADLSKGILAVVVGRLLLPGVPWVEALCGIAAVVGHNYSIYIRFRGGAGTGPNVGAAMALWPVVGLLLVPFVPIILVLTGYASIASTSAAVLILAIFGLRAAISGEPLAYVLYALITTLLVALALWPNYKRLIAGEERLVGPRAKKQEVSS